MKRLEDIDFTPLLDCIESNHVEPKSLEEALLFSIAKWHPDRRQEMVGRGICGLCKWHKNKEGHVDCKCCPFSMGLEGGCEHSLHLWRSWWLTIRQSNAESWAAHQVYATLIECYEKMRGEIA